MVEDTFCECVICHRHKSTLYIFSVSFFHALFQILRSIRLEANSKYLLGLLTLICLKQKCCFLRQQFRFSSARTSNDQYMPVAAANGCICCFLQRDPVARQPLVRMYNFHSYHHLECDQRLQLNVAKPAVYFLVTPRHLIEIMPQYV